MSDVDAETHQMEGKLRPRRPLDREIADLASKQYGVVAFQQLLALGLSPRSIDSRWAGGRLHRVHRGVYAVGHPVLTQCGQWMAAVLAGGSGALLSHASAASLWGLRPSPGMSQITVPGHGWRPHPKVLVHSSRTIEPKDRAIKQRIPVTAVARTLLDLAETETPQTLNRAFEEAERLRLIDMRELGRVYERNRGRHGLRPLRLLLAHSRLPEPAARSELERRFLDLCHEEGLPMPVVNPLVEGFEVDMLWPMASLIVELDGHEFHRTRAAFERDRIRDAALQVAGYTVIRITFRRLAKEPSRVAADIRRLLLRGRN